MSREAAAVWCGRRCGGGLSLGHGGMAGVAASTILATAVLRRILTFTYSNQPIKEKHFNKEVRDQQVIRGTKNVEERRNVGSWQPVNQNIGL